MRSAFENPAIGNSPRSAQLSSHRRAKAADDTTSRFRRAAILSSRAARLTAGPMQVKSSRLPLADIAVQELSHVQRDCEAEALERIPNPILQRSDAGTGL